MRFKFNQTNDWHIMNCDCEQSFEICLKNVNTALSNDVAYVQSINTTQCYSNDHPIIKCIKFETYSESSVPLVQFLDQPQREKYLKRCVKYQLDENRSKELQFFDMHLIDNVLFTSKIKGMLVNKIRII